MRTPVRRLGAVAVSTLTALGLAATGAFVAPAQAAAPNSYASLAADWLGGQLTDGVIHNDQYDFDDFGLSLDVFFALQRLDAGSTDRAAVIGALREDPEAYISYTDPQTKVTDRYAGATGKLATAVELAGSDPRSFGGVDLVARTESRLSSKAGEVGRGVDKSQYENSNTIGQGWVVRSLVGADSSHADDATRFLLQQQCAAGFFRVTLEAATSSSSFTCDGAADGNKSPSIDATALAIDALDVARDAGTTGLDDDIADAADWLVGQQAANGSFQDMGKANSNSTGLAAAALAGIGRTSAANHAAGWVVGHEATSSTAGSSKLRGSLGAIAFDAAAFAAGKKNGIPVDQRDQWRRATAQAAPALAALLPATTLQVTAPAGYQHAGATLDTTTSGLQPGEYFATSLGSLAAKTGAADQAGTSRSSFTLPNATRDYTLRTTGSRATRTGSRVVQVLAAKTLGQSLAKSRVGRGGTQTVTARGLASHELVRLFYRGEQVWQGSAPASGVVRHTFAVGSTTGKRQVQVRGKFDDRLARTSYFTVR